MNDMESIINEAKLFFKEIEECSFDLEQPTLKFAKDVRLLEKLGKFVMNLKISSEDTIQFKKCSKEESFELAKKIIHKLYDGKYDSYVEKLFLLMKVDRSLEKYDAAVSADYDVESGLKNYDTAIIYSLRERYSAVLLTHESTHAIYGNKIQTGFNYNYNEICSIFSDLFASHYIDQELDEDVLMKYEIIRFNTLQKSFKEYYTLINNFSDLSKDNKCLSPMELAYKYSYYNSYQYIIGTIYGFQLFQIFLQSPNEVLKDYKRVINHEISIPDFLNYYQISLRNKKEIDTFQKKLIKIAK